MLEIVDFVAAHDLVANVDPVQYTIRLLLPEDSLLLERPDMREHLGPYDAERLSYPWRPRTRQRPPARPPQRAGRAERRRQEATGRTFARIRAAVREATGEAVGPRAATAIPIGSTEGRPRLTEPWFC